MPKSEKKPESTIKKNQESGITQKQIKSTNLDAVKSDSKENTSHRIRMQVILVVYISGGKVRL